jgi:hypothetical protein
LNELRDIQLNLYLALCDVEEPLERVLRLWRELMDAPRVQGQEDRKVSDHDSAKRIEK